MARDHLHATALVLDETGLLVVGASGSGKSSLAFRLVETWRHQGRFAALVSDDQVWLDRVAGALVAEAPEPIAGLIELRGFGPSPIVFERRALVDRVVRLVPQADAPRLHDDALEVVAGVTLPALHLPERDTEGAVRACGAWLHDS